MICLFLLVSVLSIMVVGKDSLFKSTRSLLKHQQNAYRWMQTSSAEFVFLVCATRQETAIQVRENFEH